MRFMYVIIVSCISLLILSCDDEVNPKADFKEVYALNCIIQGDTTLQFATITRAYDVDGFDPNTNKLDPFIEGAKITLRYSFGNRVYNFKDTLVERTSDSRYESLMHAYYLDNFKPSTNSRMTIEALLPNGKVLSAEAQTFYLSKYSISSTLQVLPSEEANGVVTFNWHNFGELAKQQNVYYVPELMIIYRKNEGAKQVKYQKKIPLYYLNTSEGEVPYYSSIQANITTISFTESGIERALSEISEGDPVKENYTIEKAAFRLMILDKNLAVYYSSQKTYKDEFSVRVTQPEFTNINGGLGIFGSYNTTQIDLPFRENYIKMFGYRIP